MPNLNIYLTEGDYRLIDEVAQRDNKKTAAVGREWLEERCTIERKKATA